jgi:hypothetical protein
MYGSAAIGVKMNIFERPSTGLDFSMDAGYAFYGASEQTPMVKSTHLISSHAGGLCPGLAV